MLQWKQIVVDIFHQIDSYSVMFSFSFRQYTGSYVGVHLRDHFAIRYPHHWLLNQVKFVL